MRSCWGRRRIYEMWQGRRLRFKTASMMEEKDTCPSAAGF